MLEKTGKDAMYLDNWRPLSLLNTDYKIFAKILAPRMSTVLPEIIYPMQHGFIKGRNISENIVELTNIMYYCNTNKKQALLPSFDFQKAFDTVEWSAIRNVMETFYFW